MFRLLAEPVAPSVAPRGYLLESPRWDGRWWWWVDAEAGDIYRWSGSGPADLVCAAGDRVANVLPDGTGGAIATVGTRIVTMRPGGQSPDGMAMTELARVPTPGPEWILNDAVRTPEGGVIVGSVAPDRGPSGSLFHVGPQGDVEEIGSGYQLSNGLAWTDDGALLHADSFAKVVWRYRMSRAGCGGYRIADRETWLSFDDGLPDGIAVDRHGQVWIAVYGTGQVRGYRGQQQVGVIEIGTAQATSVAFGGGDDVLITTAREGLDADQAAADPTAGCLYRCSAARRS